MKPLTQDKSTRTSKGQSKKTAAKAKQKAPTAAPAGS